MLHRKNNSDIDSTETDNEEEIVTNPIIEKDRGLFIAIEGCEKTGKTTQLRLLSEKLLRNGEQVKTFIFPGDGKLYRTIKDMESYVSPESYCLMLAGNRWQTVNHIKHALFNGFNVIVEGWVDSACAYGIAKTDKSIEWVRTIHEELPMCDLSFYLKLPREIQEMRKGWGDEKHETRLIQKKVRKGFEFDVRSYRSLDEWIVMDGCLDRHTLNIEIFKKILLKLQQKRNRLKYY